MLNSLRLAGFRKYRDFKLGVFNQINFILGDNNIGKTSILEGVFTWACGQNVAPMLNIPLSRGRLSGFQNPYWLTEEVLAMVNQRKELPLKMSFEGEYDGKVEKFEHTIYPSDLLFNLDSSYKNQTDKIIAQTNEVFVNQPNRVGIPLYNAIVGQWEVKHGRSVLRTDITSPLTMVSSIKPFVNAKFVDVMSHAGIAENVQIYASLKREGLLDEVAKRMRKVFPEIAGFDMVPYPDGSQAPLSVVKKDGTILPMYAYGDGVQRWFYVIGTLTIYKNSIVTIDEIDVGLHPDAQPTFCKNVCEYAVRNNVQLFLTTHNIEFIDKFLQSIADSGNIADKVNILTLRETADGIKTRTFVAKDAYEARNEFNMELR